MGVKQCVICLPNNSKNKITIISNNICEFITSCLNYSIKYGVKSVLSIIVFVPSRLTWIKRFILHFGKKLPGELGAAADLLLPMSLAFSPTEVFSYALCRYGIFLLRLDG